MESQLKFSSYKWFIVIMAFTLSWTACKEESNSVDRQPSEKIVKPRVKIPRFNDDTAFAFIEKQLAFGYRIPGTEASIATKNWMVSKLQAYGAIVAEQEFTVDFLDQKDVPATNIIAEFNPEKKQRVLLVAHWDSRLIAEKDSNDDRKDDPIPGADDGASGTAVLLEIARTIAANPIDLGVDILLVDAEDQGESGSGSTDTWALGSQYFSRNPHKKGYKAEFGILLDMIGARNARFGKEYYSVQYAKKYTDQIWKLAQKMGSGHLFKNIKTGPVTDDHYYLNTILGVPTVDIINIPYDGAKTFGDYHHTHADDISIIDKNNLRSVGQVVTAVIYKTSDNSFL